MAQTTDVAARPVPDRASTARTDFPPRGASPAGDLQRRLARAALYGFYAPRHVPAWRRKRHLAAVAGMVVASWGVVFSACSLLAA